MARKAKFPAGKELEEICRAFAEKPQVPLLDLRDQLGEKWGPRSLETLGKIKTVVETATRLMEGRLDPALAQRRKEHWDALAALAWNLVSAIQFQGLDRLWLLEGPPSIPEDVDGLEAAWFVAEDWGGQVLRISEILGQKGSRPTSRALVFGADSVPASGKVDYRLYPYLRMHLKAQVPGWEEMMVALKVAVASLYGSLHFIAEKIVKEAESRTALPSSPRREYGLSPYYGMSVFRNAVRGMSCDYRRANMWLIAIGYGEVAITREEKELEVAQCIHAALGAEVREWAELQVARNAYEQVEENLRPVKDRLQEVSLRGVFGGECPTCP